ncbi:DUF2939 domain-containing protein [Variovorax sp. LARHSF232]
MTRNKSIALGAGLAIVLLLLVAAGIYASPYWSVHQMKEAARERDVDALLARVDQSALRQSVRLSLGFKLSEALHDAQAESGKAQAEGARAQAAAQVDPLTEALTSPPLLIAMLIEGRPSRALGGIGRLPASGDADLGEWEAQLRYVDSATVQVRSSQAPQAGGFILRRSGLIDWKLSGLLLPGQ